MVLLESKITLKTGDNAPDFSLKGIDDETHSLESYGKNKGLLVIFMCNHCPYVKACLLYTSPSPRDGLLSRMPSSA